MAQARKVKPGQVWTSKVSGKVVEVAILGDASPSPSGRRRFKVKNLSTNRTATKGAGALRELVRDVSTNPSPAAAPAAAPKAAKRTPRPAPKKNTSKSPKANPKPARASSAGLGSLRGQARSALPGGHGTRPAARGRSNPPASAYPSRAAHMAAKAIAASDAQTPREVLAVVQAWARRARMSEEERYARMAPGGVPMFNPPGRHPEHFGPRGRLNNPAATGSPYRDPRRNPQAFYGSSW